MAAKKAKKTAQGAGRKDKITLRRVRNSNTRLGTLAAEQVVPGDAIALLEQDHREVEALFEQFESPESNSTKADLAKKICLSLTVHAEIEEKIFYPAARKGTGDDDLINEALVEHASAKQLIAEIEAMAPRNKLFDATVKVLGEYVNHHVKEEEGELFSQVRKADVDLTALGRKMLKRKIALLAELAGAYPPH